MARKRPSKLRNVENVTPAISKTVEHVTFEDLIGKDFSGEPIETVYTFICEAMNVTDPSPCFLTQVTSQLKCPAIDWYDFHGSDLDYPANSGSGHLEAKTSPPSFRSVDSSFIEEDHDNQSNIKMSGALHPQDRLILLATEDSLVCRTKPEELFRYMPMKLVDLKGLEAFDLFNDPEAALAELPDDFVTTVMGIQLAKQMINRSSKLTVDKILLDMEMLVALAFYGGTFHDNIDCGRDGSEIYMPEHIRPLDRGLEVPSNVKAYWSYLSSRNKFWEDADHNARIRAIRRDLQEELAQIDRQKKRLDGQKMTRTEEDPKKEVLKEMNEGKKKRRKRKGGFKQK